MRDVILAAGLTILIWAILTIPAILLGGWL